MLNVNVYGRNSIIVISAKRRKSKRCKNSSKNSDFVSFKFYIYFTRTLRRFINLIYDTLFFTQPFHKGEFTKRVREMSSLLIVCRGIQGI